MNPLDLLIRQTSGPEPTFDPVVRAFLENSAEELHSRLRPGGLLDAVNLGSEVPWLWRLTFRSRGLQRDAQGLPCPCEQHSVTVRFPPDYLRRADRWEILHLWEPAHPFHPNLKDRHVCLEVYPGQPLVELCESLHALFGWRKRQLAENDALDPEACAWGRAHLDRLPLDDRPLFGRVLALQLDPVESTP